MCVYSNTDYEDVICGRLSEMLVNIGRNVLQLYWEYKTFEAKSEIHAHTANVMMSCVLNCYRPHSCGGLIDLGGDVNVCVSCLQIVVKL